MPNDLRTEIGKNILVKEFNKAMKLIDKKDFTKALIMLNKVRRQQEFKEVWLNLGVVYKGLNQLDKTKECFAKALDPNMPFSDGSFKSAWPLALTNMGLVYFALEDDETAEKWHLEALKADPLYYDAIWNLSLVKLRQYCSDKYSDLDKAWRYYTYRFQRTNAKPLTNDNPELLMWDFKSSGSSIVVLIEQGMGDAIMFGRYLPLLRSYFDKIWVQCTPEIHYLFSDFNVCNMVSETNATHGVPMCSLGKMLDYIPNGEWLAHKYVEKERNGKLEILCIWSGSTEHINAANRNVPAGYFDKLSLYGNLHSVVKRKGYSHMGITDWEATIKYLEKIDIVVTIDSSVAHLCGSLGKPCLVIMPLLDGDFRWGDHSMGYNNKWYRTVKVIRNNMNWESAFKEVHSCLAAL